jgi:membrane fusion protein (multidrug efflux system)
MTDKKTADSTSKPEASPAVIAGAQPAQLGHKTLRTTLIALAAGVALLVGISALPKPPAAPPPPPRLPVNVQVQAVTPIAKLVDTFVMPAVVQANRIVKVAAEVDGRIESIDVKEGLKVQAGQVLVKLNTDLLLDTYKQALANYNLANKELERVKQLQAKGISSQQDMDQAVNQYDVAEASMKLAKTRLDCAVVKAPISGILDRTPMEVGEYIAVASGVSCVAQIVDIDTVKVVAQVPEMEIGNLKIGQSETVVVKTTNGQDATFEGDITYISEVADDVTHTTRVEVSVKNPDRRLRTGQIVSLLLTRRVLDDALMIPLAAVIPNETDKEVFCVENSKASVRKVTLGFFRGSDVQILSGLKAGEQLIVSGHRYVSDGQAIQIQPNDQ